METKKLLTINQMWENSVRLHGNQKVVCERISRSVTSTEGKISEEAEFVPTTYAELDELIIAAGTGLLEVGLNEQEPVACIAENSKRWLICDQAVLGNRAFNVPRGITSTDEELIYILKHAETRFVIVESEKELQRVESFRRKIPKVKTILIMDENFVGEDTSRRIYSLDSLIQLGRKAPPEKREAFLRRRREALPGDTATLMYTSGTSGTPKGIPLIHSNLMHNVETIPALLPIDENSKFLSILPVWHIFERTVEYVVLRDGASLWYTNRFTILKDLELVNPHYMASVPRIWITVYNGVMANIRHAGKEEVFRKFYSHSLKVMAHRRWKEKRQFLLTDEEETPSRASLGDRFFHFLAKVLIYRKVTKKLGKDFIAGISGGGSLPEYIDDFFEAIGVTLLEGYGLTETSPVLCMRTFDHRIPYTIGRPLPETQVRIRDIEGRLVEGSDIGSLWVHGHQVMTGYYRNEEETKKTMETDSQGRSWFNTGDLGRWTRYGDISLVGRMKNTIVLLGGENIEPARIEMKIQASDFVSQVMVCGQDQEYLTALIVPEQEMLKAECERLAIEFSEDRIPEIGRNPRIKQIYMDILEASISEKNGFKEIETIHNMAFCSPFTPEDDTLTQTLKIKRRQVEARDGEIIRSLYPRYNEGSRIKGRRGR